MKLQFVTNATDGNRDNNVMGDLNIDVLNETHQENEYVCS